MKTLQVTGKIIETLPIVNLIQQGESNTQEIAIRLPKNIDKTDVSSLFFVLYGVGEGDVRATSLLKKVIGEDYVNVIWCISSDFTCHSFPLTLKLVGLNKACQEVLKFSGRYPILAYSDDSVTSTPTSMGAFQEALMEMQEKLDQADALPSQPPYIGENGNWYIWNTTTRLYEDSGYTASGKDGTEPSISVKNSEEGEYRLSITSKDGTIETPNLIGGLHLKQTNALYANLLKDESLGEPPTITEALPLPIDQLIFKGKTTEILPSVPKDPLNQSEIIGFTNPEFIVSGKNCFSPGSNLPTTVSGIRVEFIKETGEFLLNGVPSTNQGVSIPLDTLPFIFQNEQVYSISVAMSGGSCEGTKTTTSYVGGTVRDGTTKSIILETGFNLTQTIKSASSTITYSSNSPSRTASFSLWIGPTVARLNNLRVKIQFSLGEPSKFVPFYGSQLFSVALPPMYALPEGVSDQVDLVTGTLTRQVGSVILNGSENWAMYDDKPGFNVNHLSFKAPFLGAVGSPSYKKSNMLCSAYKLYDGDTIWATDDAGIWLPSAWEIVVIKVKKSLIPGWSDSGISTVDKIKLFKNFLQAYPVTVLFEKKLQSQETIPALDIRTYQGENSFTCTPSTQTFIKYSQDTNLVISRLLQAQQEAPAASSLCGV